MTMENIAHLTDSGLPGIERLQYGTHACHFYKNREQLADVLVPYVIAGLRANERCLWITATPLRARDAIQTLRAAWNGADDAEQSGALRILDFDLWYMNSSALKGPEMIQVWLAEEERALADARSGLRICSNTSFLAPGDWPRFMKYERALSTSLTGRRMVALCSYPLEQCTDEQMSRVVHGHQCALQHRDANWQLVMSPAQSIAGRKSVKHASAATQRAGDAGEVSPGRAATLTSLSQ